MSEFNDWSPEDDEEEDEDFEDSQQTILIPNVYGKGVKIESPEDLRTYIPTLDSKNYREAAEALDMYDPEIYMEKLEQEITEAHIKFLGTEPSEGVFEFLSDWSIRRLWCCGGDASCVRLQGFPHLLFQQQILQNLF